MFQILHRKVLAVIFFSKNEKSNIKNLNQDKMCISQVKPRPNTHDSIDYHARLNTNYHAPIIDYNQLLCNLVMFKFYRIVDDSFCRLNERMIVNDSISVRSFAKKRTQIEMASGNMTKIAFKISRNVFVAHSPHPLVGFSIFNSQLLDSNFKCHLNARHVCL